MSKHKHFIADNIKKNNLKKPEVELIGQDGNIFNLLGIARKALKDSPDAYNEMWGRIQKCNNYYEALNIMRDYITII